MNAAEQQRQSSVSVYTGCVQPQYYCVGHLCFGSFGSDMRPIRNHCRYSSCVKYKKIELKAKNKVRGTVTQVVTQSK